MQKKMSEDGTILLMHDEGYSSVIIPTKNNKSAVCVSCMIGCPVGCPICQTKGYQRNLTADEIVTQLSTAINAAGKASSVVLMGMGEPGLNLCSVNESIVAINSRFRIPFNRMTVSTIGVNLSGFLDIKSNIAISLHSPSDETRSQLVPSGAKVSEIVLFSKRREIMVSYALIEGVNDRDIDLENLLSLDWGKNTNFNLIEFNDIGAFRASGRLEEFKAKIRSAGHKCFIRESRGKDIGAACGMLSLPSD